MKKHLPTIIGPSETRFHLESTTFDNIITLQEHLLL